MTFSDTLLDTISDIESDIATAAIGVIANSLAASGVSDQAIADAMIVRALAIAAHTRGDDFEARKLAANWHRFSRGYES